MLLTYLYRYEDFMKTGSGKQLARERQAKMMELQELFEKEMEIPGLGESVLGTEGTKKESILCLNSKLLNLEQLPTFALCC